VGYSPPPSSGGGSLAALVWHAIPLAEGVSAFGGSYDAPSYAVDAQGYVHLRGLFNPAESAENMLLGTLPEAVWPKKQKLVDARDANTVSLSTTLIIKENGEIKLTSLAGDGSFLPNLNCGYDLQD
jgi:hypothetical protein